MVALGTNQSAATVAHTNLTDAETGMLATIKQLPSLADEAKVAFVGLGGDALYKALMTIYDQHVNANNTIINPTTTGVHDTHVAYAAADTEVEHGFVTAIGGLNLGGISPVSSV